MKQAEEKYKHHIMRLTDELEQIKQVVKGVDQWQQEEKNQMHKKNQLSLTSNKSVSKIVMPTSTSTHQSVQAPKDTLKKPTQQPITSQYAKAIQSMNYQALKSTLTNPRTSNIPEPTYTQQSSNEKQKIIKTLNKNQSEFFVLSRDLENGNVSRSGNVSTIWSKKQSIKSPEKGSSLYKLTSHKYFDNKTARQDMSR